MCIQNIARFVTCSCLICISISMVSRFSASTDGRICIEAFRSMISSFLSGIGDWSCCCGEIMQIIFTCDMDVVHPVPCELSPRTASDRRRRRRRPLAVAGRTLCAELSAAIPVVWRAGNWTDRAARTRCDTAATGRRSAWTARWPANDTKTNGKNMCETTLPSGGGATTSCIRFPANWAQTRPVWSANTCKSHSNVF